MENLDDISSADIRLCMVTERVVRNKLFSYHILNHKTIASEYIFETLKVNVSEFNIHECIISCS